MFRYQAGLTSRSARPGGGVIGAGSTVHGPRADRWPRATGDAARQGRRPGRGGTRDRRDFQLNACGAAD